MSSLAIGLFMALIFLLIAQAMIFGFMIGFYLRFLFKDKQKRRQN